jgi:hypothetical protein
MTNNFGRVYAITLTIVVFFLSWAIIAARPWVSAPEAKTDPRIAALNVRERRLHKDAVEIRTIVQKRWTVYHSQLVRRKHLIAVRKKAQQAYLAQQALAAQRAQVFQASAPSSTPSYHSAPAPSAPAPSAPIVRVAPPAAPAPPATHTKTS